MAIFKHLFQSSGGVQLEITGENLDSVPVPVLVITLVYDECTLVREQVSIIL